VGVAGRAARDNRTPAGQAQPFARTTSAAPPAAARQSRQQARVGRGRRRAAAVQHAGARTDVTRSRADYTKRGRAAARDVKRSRVGAGVGRRDTNLAPEVRQRRASAYAIALAKAKRRAARGLRSCGPRPRARVVGDFRRGDAAHAGDVTPRWAATSSARRRLSRPRPPDARCSKSAAHAGPPASMPARAATATWTLQSRLAAHASDAAGALSPRVFRAAGSRVAGRLASSASRRAQRRGQWCGIERCAGFASRRTRRCPRPVHLVSPFGTTRTPRGRQRVHRRGRATRAAPQRGPRQPQTLLERRSNHDHRSPRSTSLPPPICSAPTAVRVPPSRRRSCSQSPAAAPRWLLHKQGAWRRHARQPLVGVGASKDDRSHPPKQYGAPITNLHDFKTRSSTARQSKSTRAYGGWEHKSHDVLEGPTGTESRGLRRAICPG